MFGFPNRGRPDILVDHATPLIAPSPLKIRLRHIDRELATLAALPDKTPYTWAAIDHWLDRRLTLRPGLESRDSRG